MRKRKSGDDGMTGRPRLKVGELGTPRFEVQPDGRIIARAKLRDPMGKIRRPRGYGHTSEEALESLKLAAAKITRGAGFVDAVHADSSIAELAQFWLDEEAQEERLAPQSIAKYASDVRRIIVPGIGDLTISELTVGTADAFLSAVRRDRSANAAKIARVILKQMMSLAVRKGAAPTNSIRETRDWSKRKRTEQAKKVVALSTDQVAEIREALRKWERDYDRPGPRPDGQLRQFVDIMLGTSARPGEVLALRRCDVDFSGESPRVRISGTIVRVNGTIERQEHTKDPRQHRIIVLPAFAAEAIRERLAKTAGGSPEAFLFQTRNGRPVWPNNIGRQWRAFRAQHPRLAGTEDLERMPPYIFRKTVASALSAEAGIAIAAETLGHASEGTTKRHYVQPIDQVNPLTATLLDSLFGTHELDFDPNGFGFQ